MCRARRRRAHRVRLSSDSPLRYSVLYARRTAAISAAEKPRRRKPSLFVPRGLCRVAGRRDVRWDVLQHDRARGEHRVRADAAELMDAGVRAQHHPVADRHVPSDLRVVRERREVADDAVVRDVRVGEKPVAVADRAWRRGPAQCPRGSSRIRGPRCRRRAWSSSARRRTCGPAESRRPTRTGRCGSAHRSTCVP